MRVFSHASTTTPLLDIIVIILRHIALQHREHHKHSNTFYYRKHNKPSVMAPYGRGGAGNYEAIQRENEKVNNDLERSQSTADKDVINYVPPDIAERSEAQYAHTGRGGAGNYYSPRDLVETGNFSGAQTSHIRESGLHCLKAFERYLANPRFPFKSRRRHTSTIFG